MNEKIDFALRIIAWALIGIGVFLVLLKVVGVLHSPEETLVNSLIAMGVLIELGRIDAKVSLLWDDSKKRKKV